MVKQDIFHVMVERNLKGRDLEKSGKEDVAITLYEENVADRFDGSHPYDRLRVIYTRRKDFDGAIRVCQQYIELSGEEGKRGKFQEHLNKLYVKKDNLKKR